MSNKQQFFVLYDSLEASYQSIVEEIVCKKSWIRNSARDTHAITTNILQSSVHLIPCHSRDYYYVAIIFAGDSQRDVIQMLHLVLKEL